MEISKQIQSIKKTLAELEAQRSRLESEIFYNYQLLGAKYAAERMIQSSEVDFSISAPEKPAPLPKGTIAKGVSNVFNLHPDKYFTKEHIAEILKEAFGQSVSENAIYVALKRAEKRKQIYYDDVVDAWRADSSVEHDEKDWEDLPF